MPTARTSILLLLLAGSGAASGCLGGTYNPSYFPHYLLPGDVRPTHAKPAGLGYFADFDPKAARLDLTPGACTNPTKSQQVLIATVYDQDGKPRRKRRVEWILDGPGYIVEVDESGLLPGRGYKADNKYAVSYTDYREHKITRGNSDPDDDFTVTAGQTWCVVSCAVEGLTTVTAYAPEVYCWDKGRVTAKLTWTDSEFRFPPPTTSRSGGEAELNTTLTRFRGDSVGDLKVRYKVLDGPAAVLVTKSGTGSRSSQLGALTETEVSADADGKAVIRVAQPTPQTGTTRIAVEVFQPDPAGLGAGTVVARKETTIEWAAAALTLDIVGPKLAGVGRPTDVSLSLINDGKADSQPVTLRATLPEGVEFVRADPAPTTQSRDLTWKIGAIPGGKKQTIGLVVRPSRKGSATVTAVAETADGLRAEHRTTFGVDTAGVTVAVEAPPTVGIRESAPVTVAVTNPGAVPLDNVTAWVAFDSTLAHESAQSPVEVAIGSVPGGETKRVAVKLSGAKTGRAVVRVSATADGGLAERAETTIDVRKAGLTVAVAGPDTVSLGEEAVWEVRIANVGDGPVADVRVKLRLPTAIVAKAASDGGTVAGSDGAEWTLPGLRSGDKRTLRVTATADRPTTRAVLAGSITAGGLTASGETNVTVAGKAALVLELADVPATLSAGKTGLVRITVRNRGTGPAQKVDVSAIVSDGLIPTGGTGADKQPAKVEGKTVRYGLLDTLPAGSVAVFLLPIDAGAPGTARILAEVRADHLAQTLREEQAVRVTSGF